MASSSNVSSNASFTSGGGETINILSIIGVVIPLNSIFFVGGVSSDETIVAANASLSTIVPPLLDTVISPEEFPNSSGSNITRDLPSSSIVVVKSVPRTAIEAVGV